MNSFTDTNVFIAYVFGIDPLNNTGIVNFECNDTTDFELLIRLINTMPKDSGIVIIVNCIFNLIYLNIIYSSFN